MRGDALEVEQASGAQLRVRSLDRVGVLRELAELISERAQLSQRRNPVG